MILELLSLVIGYYLFAGFSVYGFAVLKSWEYTGKGSFTMKDGYIGICKYPRWLLGWAEWIMNKVRS